MASKSHNLNRPHLYEAFGNTIFVHIGASFEDDEIENWANKTYVLSNGDRWLLAPTSAESPFNKAECISDPHFSIHVCLTVNGQPYNPNVPPPEVTYYDPDAN